MFEPGDFCTPVCEPGPGTDAEPYFRFGLIYKVRDFLPAGTPIPHSDWVVDGDTLCIEGVPDDYGADDATYGWPACAFRPVRRPDPKFLTELLHQPVPLFGALA